MTQEEKFEEAKRLYQTANSDQKYVLESLFPELAESEDERIRKVLLNDFKNNCSEYYCEGINRDMIIAWLEKQAQKPATWSEEDEQHIDSLLKRLDGLCRNEFERTRFAINEDMDWLKALKPQNTWKPSDEQMKQLHKYCPDNRPLTQLYQDLKKLIE